MSAVLGVNATKAADPSAANILSPGTLGGKVRVMVDSYEASTLADGSTIAVGKALPVGAIVTGIKVAFDALGGSTTLAVGDAGSAARYIAAASSASAGMISTMKVDGLGYKITGTDDEQILITLAGAAATGTISAVIEYVVE